jgi:hypothetical protein
MTHRVNVPTHTKPEAQQQIEAMPPRPTFCLESTELASARLIGHVNRNNGHCDQRYFVEDATS